MICGHWLGKASQNDVTRTALPLAGALVHRLLLLGRECVVLIGGRANSV